MIAADNELFMPTPRHARAAWLSIKEEGIIDFVAKLSPWLAPLPTAVFVKESAAAHLGTNDYLSWVIALVIETLGITTTHTALGFWSWNQTHDNNEKAPFALSVALAAVYIVATLGLLFVLEVNDSLSVYASVIFPFLSVVGAVNLAMRSHHNRRVNAENETNERLLSRQWQIEDEQRATQREERRLKLSAKLGLTVNPSVNRPSKSENDGQIDNQIDRMIAAKHSKVDARREMIVAMLRDNPSIAKAEIQRRLGLGSVNTVKGDLRALAQSNVIAIHPDNSIEVLTMTGLTKETTNA